MKASYLKTRRRIKIFITSAIEIGGLVCSSYYKNKVFDDSKFRILTYHRVCSMPKENQIEYYAVSPEKFEEQMAFLYENKFNVVTLEEVFNWTQENIKPPKKTIIIVFHDGFGDNAINALPILKKYGFRAMFFVASAYLGSDRPFPWLNMDEQALIHYKANRELWLPFTRDQILEMSDCGMVIGSHSRTHSSLALLSKERVVKELRASKEDLEVYVNKPIKWFAFPFGLWGDVKDDHRILIQESGYKGALTAKMGSNNIRDSLYDLKAFPIYQSDSITNFRYKAEGAYDWLKPFHFTWINTFPKNANRLSDSFPYGKGL